MDEETHKHEDNEAFVDRLMAFSAHGPLMQAFVLTALQKYAEQCVQAGPAIFETDYLSGRAWVGCAEEVRTELAARLAARTPPPPARGTTLRRAYAGRRGGRGG
jgi:hypothetical protein